MPQEQVGRLALRLEGDLWNAYYAMPDTMDGAILLGSLRMRLAHDPLLKQAFMALMQEAVSRLLQEKFGERPTWPTGPQPAPEHERGGRA